MTRMLWDEGVDPAPGPVRRLSGLTLPAADGGAGEGGEPSQANPPGGSGRLLALPAWGGPALYSVQVLPVRDAAHFEGD